VIKPPMAKIADVFGRLEAFSLCVLLLVVGYIQQATSSNVQTYAAAQVFYSAGFTGLQILQQIFIADTSDLLNRALWSSLPDLPFLITVWIGAPIGNQILKTTTWRWGYGIWCIVLPVAFLPLALSLFINNRNAKRLGLAVSSPWKGLRPLQVVRSTWFALDVGGMVLLSAAFALMLLPLTIASKAAGGWSSSKIIVMIALGVVCLIFFLLWDSVKKAAPHPLIPLSLLKSHTFCAGCGISFFYFSKAHHCSIYASANHISGILSLGSTLLLLLPSRGPGTLTVYLTCVEIGGVVGSAIAGAVWGHDIPRKLNAYLPPTAQVDAQKIYDSINVALEYPKGSPERLAINRAYQETMHTLLIISMSVSVPVFLLSLVVRNVALDGSEGRVKGRVIGGTAGNDRVGEVDNAAELKVMENM
ncbi:hypothetical protein ACMFMF_003058, partial [Clarireedia jacksonii]